MVENSANKGPGRSTSEKPNVGDSSWLRWVKSKSVAMNKRFISTNSDFLKNLKKEKRNRGKS